MGKIGDQAPDGSQPLSTREAAAALGLSERTIRRAIASGELRAVKSDWAHRIDRESLDRFAARMAKPTGSRPLARIVDFPGGTDAAPLPEPLSSFIGRGADIAAVLAMLDDDATRLLTLTGPGGIGKTRLALAAVGAFAEDQFPDGIAFVPLADVHSPRLVMPAVAQALGLRTPPGSDSGEQLRAILLRKRLLLVLDNFEHLLPAGPEVSALLTEAPQVTALVTSRAPLRVTGERELAVQPMSVAAAGATSAEVLVSDAGRLFAERAREHDAAFRVDDETAPLIAVICARLDGLPLAIELAAARVKILSPRELVDRLEPRLPLLTRGARNAPARHSTMRNAIAWSYDLLPPSAQRYFQRLAVFSGGATLEAAEAVIETPDDEREDATDGMVIDTIADLIDHGLLISETGLDGTRRFRMLETIREFGLEQLAAVDASEGVRARHAAYFLSLSGALRPLASTQASYGPFDTLATEYANLLESLAWLEAHGPAADFVALVADLCEFWYTSSFSREARPWVERAMPQLDFAAPIDRGRLLAGYGIVLMTQGDVAQAEPFLAQGLERLRAAGDALHTARTLILTAAVFSVTGRFAEAEAPLRESLALAETVSDADLRAATAGRALTNLCCAARGQGDLARARTYGEEALHLFAGRPFAPLTASALVDLGSVAYDAGEYDWSLSRLREGIALMGERGDMRQVADALSLIACIATTWGAPRAALLLFGAADALRERVGAAMVWPSDIAAVERNLAALREGLGEPEVAETLAAGRALSRAEAVDLAAGLAAPAQQAPTSGALDAPHALTRREREVLRLMAEHKSDREIAEALFLSLRTVNWHVRAILGKLDSASRGDAVARARTIGLL